MPARKARHKVYRLTIAVVDDPTFDKGYANARRCFALWDSHTSTIFLRGSRRGSKRFADFIHECKHAYVDLVDEDE